MNSASRSLAIVTAGALLGTAFGFPWNSAGTNSDKPPDVRELVLLLATAVEKKDQTEVKRQVDALNSPDTNTWADPLPIPPEVVKSIRNGNYGFYDPELNAYFCHFASDSIDDGTMWVYRYKNVKR